MASMGRTYTVRRPFTRSGCRQVFIVLFSFVAFPLHRGNVAWGLDSKCTGEVECADFATQAIDSFIDVFKPEIEAKDHNLGRPASQLIMPCVPRLWLLLSGEYRTFKDTR